MYNHGVASTQGRYMIVVVTVYFRIHMILIMLILLSLRITLNYFVLQPLSFYFGITIGKVSSRASSSTIDSNLLSQPCHHHLLR